MLCIGLQYLERVARLRFCKRLAPHVLAPFAGSSLTSSNFTPVGYSDHSRTLSRHFTSNSCSCLCYTKNF